MTARILRPHQLRKIHNSVIQQLRIAQLPSAGYNSASFIPEGGVVQYHPDHPIHVTRQAPLRLSFIGSGGEYFRIWIVNLLLSIVTLGFYSPWAKVRRERYFANHTLLKDSPFEYHARPIAILKGRLLAIGVLVAINLIGLIDPRLSLLTIPVFLFGLPWAIRATLRFKAVNTSWRGIRFSFKGTTWGAAKVLYGWGLLIIISGGLAMPTFIRAWHRYIFGHLYFGSTPFSVETKVGPYYKPYVILGLILFLIFGALGLIAVQFRALLPDLSTIEASPVTEMLVTFIPLMIILIFNLLSYAFIQTRIRNYLFNHIMLARHGLGADLRARDMLGLVLWNGLLTVLTLGLYLPVLIVALRRYRTTHTLFYTFGSLDDFMAEVSENVPAFGEELADFMDLDFGL